MSIMVAAALPASDAQRADPKPFIWKATADDIIAKVQRGRDTLHRINSQTDH